MRRYYFDVRDQEGLVVDEEGMELPDMEAVRTEALQSMVDAAYYAPQRPSISGKTTIEVRDEVGHAMTARIEIAMQNEREN